MSWKVQLHETRRHRYHSIYVLDSLNRKRTAAKETVEWCRLNGHRSWKTVSSRLFPGIKDP